MSASLTGRSGTVMTGRAAAGGDIAMTEGGRNPGSRAMTGITTGGGGQMAAVLALGGAAVMTGRATAGGDIAVTEGGRGPAGGAMTGITTGGG